MSKKRYKVSGEDKRLDIFLKEEISDFSRSFLQDMIRRGNIVVNGEKVKPRHRVQAGDEVTADLPDETGPGPESMPLKIAYEDASIAVVDKPPGLIVHPAGKISSGTLVNGLLYRYGRNGLSSRGGSERPGIVHRLDKDTSGLMVVARTDNAHDSLTAQFKRREVKKEYLALVKGKMGENTGEIRLPLRKDYREKTKVKIKFIEGKEAITRYRVLEELAEATLLEVSIETGRTHQIRVHLSAVGHPILGDARYGIRAGLKRQALHAWKLGFLHPESKEYVEFTSPLPEDLKKIYTGMGGNIKCLMTNDK